MQDDMSASLDLDLDPRQRRTRDALAAAVLELASDQAAVDISVSALARAAGVHRSTVYQHATSPAALLARVLSDELDAVREAHLRRASGAELGSALRATTLGVLEHLEKHETIYRRELEQGMTPLRAMLRSHFAESVREVVEQHELHPADVDGLPADFPDLAARWIADASVGAMGQWLRGPKPRSRDSYLRGHTALLPAWWPR